MSLKKSSLSLAVGGAETLVAAIAPSGATNQGLSWTSSKKTVATVSSGGAVKAIANGSATITVKTSDGGFIATCTVTVTTPVSGVSLNKSSTTILTGASETLFATIAPATASNKSVSWSTSDPSVATVSNGTVAAVAAGSATITATASDGGKTASCAVTVSDTAVSVTGVSLDTATLSLVDNGSQTLVATVSPSTSTNQNLSWSSSNTSVATVTQGGKVSAVAAGTSTITVTTADGGKTASCTVTVTVTNGSIDLTLN